MDDEGVEGWNEENSRRRKRSEEFSRKIDSATFGGDREARAH